MPWDESVVDKIPVLEPKGEGRVLSYVEAIREALETALRLDPAVMVLGQGVTDPGAMFGTTKGLEKYGTSRVFDTPVAEEGMTGICVGAAMNGMRPVMMHNRPDFLLLSFNQIVSHAAKMHFMDNGQTNVPLVIWSAIGRGWGSGPQHSQAIQGMLLGVPGLKIVMPSTPYDAKGLLLSAIKDNNPVLIFEHRWLMKQKGIVPSDPYFLPIGRAVYRRRGKDLSIVGSSHALEIAQAALDLCPEVSADVLDLRTIKPLDEGAIIDTVKNTGRLLVVDTAWQIGGVCAEVACLAAEKAFAFLRGPVRRIGLPDIPTPAGYTLEQFFYPDKERIAGVIREMVR